MCAGARVDALLGYLCRLKINDETLNNFGALNPEAFVFTVCLYFAA